MTEIDERDRWRGWMEDNEGYGTLLWETKELSSLEAERGAFFFGW